MNLVEPIRDLKKVDKMKSDLKKRSTRDYILFTIGCNSALRISDLVQLKVKDIKNTDCLDIKEIKTKKNKRFYLNPQFKKEIAEYVKDMDDDDYLFCSRKGENSPISRIQAYRILKEVAESNGIQYFGTHSMRKTFGYHYYKKTKDIAKLMYLLNHSSEEVTLRYIGITQEEIQETLEGFFI